MQAMRTNGVPLQTGNSPPFCFPEMGTEGGNQSRGAAASVGAGAGAGARAGGSGSGSGRTAMGMPGGAENMRLLHALRTLGGSGGGEGMERYEMEEESAEVRAK